MVKLIFINEKYVILVFIKLKFKMQLHIQNKKFKLFN
jgi:hypothetical protein